MPLPNPRITAGVAAVAIPLICSFEGLYTHAYLDPVGVPTVCFGHIEDVQMGDRYTADECKQMLLDDLPRYEAGVQKCIHVPMPNERHAAILSFTYNVGEGNLCKSSVARHLNAGRIQEGCDALLLYNKARSRVTGELVVLPGLDRRRKEERRLCLLDKPLPIPPVLVPEVTPEVKPAPKPTVFERVRAWFKKRWFRWFG